MDRHAEKQVAVGKLAFPAGLRPSGAHSSQDDVHAVSRLNWLAESALFGSIALQRSHVLSALEGAGVSTVKLAHAPLLGR